MPVCVLISELKEIGGAPRRLGKYSLLAAIRNVSRGMQRVPMHPRGYPPPPVPEDLMLDYVEPP